MLARFVEQCDLDVVLCAGRYTLLEQGALDDLMPACERTTTSVVIGGVFNSGVLVAPSRRRALQLRASAGRRDRPSPANPRGL